MKTLIGFLALLYHCVATGRRFITLPAARNRRPHDPPVPVVNRDRLAGEARDRTNLMPCCRVSGRAERGTTPKNRPAMISGRSSHGSCPATIGKHGRRNCSDMRPAWQISGIRPRARAADTMRENTIRRSHFTTTLNGRDETSRPGRLSASQNTSASQKSSHVKGVKIKRIASSGAGFYPHDWSAASRRHK